jgi:hypothetical protein
MSSKVVWLGVSAVFLLASFIAYQVRPRRTFPQQSEGEQWAASPDNVARPSWAQTTIQRLGPTQWYVKLWSEGWFDTGFVVPRSNKAIVHGPPLADPAFQFSATCGGQAVDSVMNNGYPDAILDGSQCTGSIKVRRHAIPPGGELQLQIFLVGLPGEPQHAAITPGRAPGWKPKQPKKTSGY